MWQALNDEFAIDGVDVLLIGLDVVPTNCHQYMDRAVGVLEAGHSLIDTNHATVGALGFKNVPMSMWVDENGTVVMDAHHSPVVKGWGDRPIPEGLPPRMEGRLVELKKATDRHVEYLAALRLWVKTGSVPLTKGVESTKNQALAVAAFELGDHFRRLGDRERSVQYWREAHRLDPDNWAAKRQAWTLVTTADGQAPDLVQEDTGPYEGNWLDDLVAVGGIDNYYPPTDW